MRKREKPVWALPRQTSLLGGLFLLPEAPVNGILDALDGVDIERRDPVVRRDHHSDDVAHSGQLKIAAPGDDSAILEDGFA